WALLYNAGALGGAAAGLIGPWQAALGMAASSLLVLVNASRSLALPGKQREARTVENGDLAPRDADDAVGGELVQQARKRLLLHAQARGDDGLAYGQVDRMHAARAGAS